MVRILKISIIFIILFINIAWAQESPTTSEVSPQIQSSEEVPFFLPAPENVQAEDRPNDRGNGIIISWSGLPPEIEKLGKAIKIEISRSTNPKGSFEILSTKLYTSEITSYNDTESEDTETRASTSVERNKNYYYKVRFLTDTESSEAVLVGPVAAKDSWLNTRRINALLIALFFASAVLTYIKMAKGGRELYIRRVSGLSEIDEALGRATEMGKKSLFITGIVDISEIQTLAGLAILGYVAKVAAQYGTEVLNPNTMPLTMAAAKEVVKEAYMTVGKPDEYKEENIFFVTTDQFAFAAAVSAIMVRERPAANFLLGWFAAESLILAETGQSIGAIQIAGTAQVEQLPFFVTACDYTIIGEELYAAGAYLSREPKLLGSIKGQDLAKLTLMILLLLGIIYTSFGHEIPAWLLVLE